MSKVLARVNQQPSMQQLADLSTGWAAFIILRQMRLNTVHFFVLLITVFFLYFYILLLGF
jgi:hypothetical protein